MKIFFKKYNNSYKKFLYYNFLGPILGIIYNFINKLVLNYIYKCFLENKKCKIIILRSYIDFYYSKQNDLKKRQIDNKLFYYNSSTQTNSFLHYEAKFKIIDLNFVEKDFLFFLEKNEQTRFRNICQIGAAGGKNLQYFGKKYNFKNLIYSEIDNSQIELAKKIYGKNFSYFKAGAQEIDIILNSPLFEKKNNDLNNLTITNNKKDIDVFFSMQSLQYCSPVMLKDFMSKISSSKSTILLLISEPIELDFLTRKKNFESRKQKAFNFKYDFFVKQAGIKILKTSVYEHNKSKEDKYFKNIATYSLLAQIN